MLPFRSNRHMSNADLDCKIPLSKEMKRRRLVSLKKVLYSLVDRVSDLLN